MRPIRVMLACAALTLALDAPALAQTTPSPRATGRLSIFTNTAQSAATGQSGSTLNEMTTAFSYRLPELDTDGFDYGADIRVSTYSAASNPTRTSIYEAFVGARLDDGAVRIRLGNLWLNDLGSLGTVAGGMAEYRTRKPRPDAGRFRIGGFWGLEPDVLDAGYASNVRKFGGYATYEGNGARRDALGLVVVKNASLTERTVLTTTNFVPAGRKFFLYQAAEYDLTRPAGQGQSGLTYFFSTVRVLPTDRLDIQGNYNHGHSIDARGLSEDLLNGRPITAQAAAGLVYESLGGRVTVEVVRRVRVYAGYARDKNNRDSGATGRTTLGGYAANIRGSGLDLSVTESIYTRPTGGYQSTYFSLGRQFGRRLYVEGDYSTSLSVVRFSRSDGVVIETRPHTARYSGTGTINLSRLFSLIVTGERTLEDQFNETRIFTGLTYRIQ